MPAPQTPPCRSSDGGYPEGYLVMNFFESTLTVNNLGGVGPDSDMSRPWLLYENVGTMAYEGGIKQVLTPALTLTLLLALALALTLTLTLILTLTLNQIEPRTAALAAQPVAT